MSTQLEAPPCSYGSESVKSTDVRFSKAAGVDIALLTGGGDKPYALGLSRALAEKGVRMEFIASDDLDCPEFHAIPGLEFLNLRGSQSEDASFGVKARRIFTYYLRLLRYAAVARPKVFHILWNNRFQTIDRTLLMLYYRFTGRRVVFTAHNVNAAKRDLRDSMLNRITLRIQYHLSNHIFVHTEKMKAELMSDFGVDDRAVTVIPFGINNAVPRTSLTRSEARQRLGISQEKKTILFFGRIGPYKGLEFLASAFQQIAAQSSDYQLMIVGKPKKGGEQYLEQIERSLASEIAKGSVFRMIDFIPDEDTEIYFKAADVVALPYTESFQSGVLFLAYSFGVPVVASNVGSFGDDIIPGRTGLLCAPGDAADLARTIQGYFSSDLYLRGDERRMEIEKHANSNNSWNTVAEITVKKYMQLRGLE